jgi:hypothetical protein
MQVGRNQWEETTLEVGEMMQARMMTAEEMKEGTMPAFRTRTRTRTRSMGAMKVEMVVMVGMGTEEIV